MKGFKESQAPQQRCGLMGLLAAALQYWAKLSLMTEHLTGFLEPYGSSHINSQHSRQGQPQIQYSLPRKRSTTCQKNHRNQQKRTRYYRNS